MSSSKDVHFSLKVMINKEKTKVLFAEADSGFADVLLSFLTLPLGRVVALMQKHYEDKAPVIGSLTTLYKGLANLDDVHFWTEGGKKMLLNPRSSLEAECRHLKLNLNESQPPQYFMCGDLACKRKKSPKVSLYYDTMRCHCGKLLNKAMGVKELKTEAGDGGGVFIRKNISFLVSDDLRIAPSLPGSMVKTLVNLGITDTDGAEMRIVTFGFDQVMDLLKGSLLSRTPLTDIIIHGGNRICVPVDIPHENNNASTSSPTTNMIKVKAILQKSTNKLLFAQSEEDFVDFLFSLLVIPLAAPGFRVANISIDYLFRSALGHYGDNHLRATGNRLINPRLPPKYLTKNHIFYRVEQAVPDLYYSEIITSPRKRPIEQGSWMRLQDPKGNGSYVKKPGVFMITDDLTVTPLCMNSSLSVLSRLKIPLSDVKEMELNIGVNEARSMLKASLTSSCALTYGLVNPALKKQVQSGVEETSNAGINKYNPVSKKQVKQNPFEGCDWS